MLPVPAKVSAIVRAPTEGDKAISGVPAEARSAQLSETAAPEQPVQVTVIVRFVTVVPVELTVRYLVLQSPTRLVVFWTSKMLAVGLVLEDATTRRAEVGSGVPMATRPALVMRMRSSLPLAPVRNVIII